MPPTGDNHVALVYFFGTFGMILLAGAIFFFFVTYQKRLLKKELELNKVKTEKQEEILQNTILAEEKERKRIAGDLHDEVGAMLSVVKLNVSRIEKNVDSEKSKLLAIETKSYLDEVITQIRRISRDLLPPSLEKFGLYHSLEDLINWINKSGQLKILLWSTENQFRFDQKKELAVFRVIQELLNNAIKHSEASIINLNLSFHSERIGITVSDNGKGFSIDEKLKTGLGLKNLDSRAQILDAKYKIKSKPGKGTTAIICFKS